MEGAPLAAKPPVRRTGRPRRQQKEPRPRPSLPGGAGLEETPGGAQRGEAASASSCGRYPLRRGSSFTFLTPGSQWDFTLKRKRRERDDDAVSICSFDLKVIKMFSPECPVH
ncbi:neuroepithelial cell-transforming gene 1 protein-like [Thamnophis elegans]|uniref:neuroepithelial cell-transforming gene 1 protein-like n=1 Tax=Thamnophis elegans TaxID=35005 RepID=UPI001377982B|nr:neuroepithelial cell-transforming gene 1 protein-like [Thamnophis elegans]